MRNSQKVYIVHTTDHVSKQKLSEGNVGGNAAKIFYHRDAIIVGLSDESGGIYCKNGLNADAILDYVGNGGLLKDYSASDIIHISNEEILLTAAE